MKKKLLNPFRGNLLLLLLIGLFSNQMFSQCDADGGSITGGPYEFIVGDGTPDMIPEGNIVLADEIGENFGWVVTDDEGYILGLPPMPSVVDFDGAGAGTCLIWHIAYDGEITGAQPGLNTNDIEGCFDLSNPIEVIRILEGDCQANGGDIFGGPFEFTVGDDIADMIPEGSITTANTNGENFGWVVTDDEGYILGLPPMPSVVDFDGAGAGTCLIWHIAYDGEITGAQPGLNANDIEGCFDLSNPIEVIRTLEGDCQANGGDIFGGPFEFTVGDDIADMIPEGSITTANTNGENFGWVVTDDEGYILGLPPMPSVVDFDGAGAGVCLIWHIAYDGEITGAQPGLNANDIEGCFDLSNPIEVIRTLEGDCQANGGDIFGGPFEFTVGDDIADMIPEGSITTANTNGENFGWVVTDDEGYILGLPPMPSVVDFDGAGAGTCLIWHIAYDGEITGAQMGLNANDIEGCFDLSNPIEVIRILEGDCQANGGDIFGGPFEFTVGDDIADMIPEGSITTANTNGENFGWVVTDDEGNILGLPPMPSVVDFDGAGAGTCLIWHIAYDGEITGAQPGLNANDIEGCFDLSNPIEVIRILEGDCQANGGDIFGGPFEFTVGDDIADMIPEGSITTANTNGENFGWVVTDDEGNILGLPPMPSVVDFDGAGAGTCLIWHIAYDGEITGAQPGLNANDIEGCFDLSNPIEVIRTLEGDCQANGGDLFGGPFTFCVGDDVADFIPETAINLANTQGENNQWVVTEPDGTILGLPQSFTDVDFDGAGGGTCFIWYLSFDGEIAGAQQGLNVNDIEGCFDLSNPVEVIRILSDAPLSGGTLDGGPFDFCVDGEADFVSGITLDGQTEDANSAWIITDDQGNILGLPPMPGVVDFDAAGPGICFIWNLAYQDGLLGLEEGNNVSDLAGCYALSNSIEVVRNQVSGGELTGGPFDFCVDGEADFVSDITLTGAEGGSIAWIVTDEQGNILGLPPMPGVVDFDAAGVGVCLIWNITFIEGLANLEVGNNVSELVGCYALSNSVLVDRNQPIAGELVGQLEYEFCVDDEADFIGDLEVEGASGDNGSWVVVDEDGTILGLPGSPQDVDFNPAGEGICYLGYISYADGLTGLEVGMNAEDFVGCFSETEESVMVTRTTDPDVCTTSTSNIDKDLVGISVSPNPATDIFTVTLSSDLPSQDFNWVLVNNIGQVIDKGISNTNTQSIQLNGSDYQPGIYSFRALIDRNAYTERVIIIK